MYILKTNKEYTINGCVIRIIYLGKQQTTVTIESSVAEIDQFLIAYLLGKPEIVNTPRELKYTDLSDHEINDLIQMASNHLLAGTGYTVHSAIVTNKGNVYLGLKGGNLR